MSHFGIDPADLTPEQMWGREPLSQADGVTPDVEPSDRADCAICAGAGWYPAGLTDRPEQVQCDFCNGTGVEQTRDELANFSPDDE